MIVTTPGDTFTLGELACTVTATTVGRGVLTVTRVVALAEPPGPVAEMV